MTRDPSKDAADFAMAVQVQLSRIRTALLLLMREPVGDDERQALGEVADILREDEEAFQSELFASLELPKPVEEGAESSKLFDQLSPEQQHEALNAMSPLDEEHVVVAQLTEVLRQGHKATSHFLAEAQSPVVVVPLGDLAENISLFNVDAVLRQRLQRFAGLPLTHSTLVAAHQVVLAVLVDLSRTIGVGPEFWDVGIEHDPEERRLHVRVVPGALVDAAGLSVQEEAPGRWVASVSVSSSAEPLTVVGSHSLEVMVGMAKLLSARRVN
jgi:hypothetical protein